MRDPATVLVLVEPASWPMTVVAAFMITMVTRGLAVCARIFLGDACVVVGGCRAAVGPVGALGAWLDVGVTPLVTLNVAVVRLRVHVVTSILVLAEI